MSVPTFLPKLVETEIAAKIEMKSSYREMKEERRKAASELEAHKQNSLQIVRLNNWLQEHNLGKPGECVTDTIIELLEKAVSPNEPRVVVNSDCPWTYDELRYAGWTDEQLVEHGYARWLPQPQSFQSRVMNAIHIKPTVRQDYRLSPEYVQVLQSLTGCKVKTEIDGTSEEDKMLLQKMIDNYARLREVEGEYKQLAEKVADAFSYCPTNLR